MNWQPGDRVEWESTNSRFVFRGVIEGFYGEGRAMCTDQSGRGSRPVRTTRLRRSTVPLWQTGKVA